MTTHMGKRGEVVIPKAIRVSCEISPGDEFEVIADEDDLDLILLRRIRSAANAGLVEHLAACPCKGPLWAPARRREPMREART
jgi:AbrB family looped-hinge helix DNA binding protein